MRILRVPVWSLLGIAGSLCVFVFFAPRDWRGAANAEPGIGGDVAARTVTSARGEVSAQGLPPRVAAPASVAENRPTPCVEPALGQVDRRPADGAHVESLLLPTAASPGEQDSPVTVWRLPGDSSTAARLDRLEPALDEPAVTRGRTSTDCMVGLAAVWPMPAELVGALRELARSSIASDWSDHVLSSLRRLHAVDSLADEQAGQALERLGILAGECRALADNLQSPHERTRLTRTGYGLERRLAVWRSVHELASCEQRPTLCAYRPAELLASLRGVSEQLDRCESPEVWQKYLLLDRLQQTATQPANAEQRGRLAREVLVRLEYASLGGEEQNAFFGQEPWTGFARQMRQWASEPVDFAAMLDDIDRFEHGGSGEAARQIASRYQILRWSPDPQVAQLADQLNAHYRNANVRIAISGELINRILPVPEAIDEDVDQMLLGGRVLGRSRTSSRLRVELFPDRSRWNMGFEAYGDVASQTSTKRGPAKFHNAGHARFFVQKPLLFDRNGLRTRNAEADATSRADLTRVETDFDDIPVLNFVVRSIARQQYNSQSDKAVSQSKNLVVDQVQARIDKEVEQELHRLSEAFDKRVGQPLDNLGLVPEPVDLQTTEERLIARYRLATFDQLAGHTARPQAPGDSYLSVQIHESAINNLIARLGLDGRRSDLHSLVRDIAQKLQKPDAQIPEDIPERVTIQLADHDAMVVRCDGDRIHVTLSVVELSDGEHRPWRNFEAHATYAVEVDGPRVRLFRDGYVGLKARKKITLGDQVALRGVFSKVFSQHPKMELLTDLLTSDKRLDGLVVTQFIMRDGWIGVAIGPDRNKTRRVATGTKVSG